MSDPTSGNASLDGGYLDPFPEMDEHGNMPSDSGESPVSGGGYLDPFPDMDEYGNTPGDIDTGGYKDPFPDMPSNYPSVSPEEEAEVLESLYDYSIGGLTKQIRSPAFDAMTTAEQDSLLEAYAGEMVKQGLYDESQMLYISPDLQDELGVRGVVWDPEATSLGAGLGTEMLSPISQTADRPVTLEEFMSDIGVSSDTPSGKRQTKFLREKLRHIAHSDDAFSPTTLLGPGLEGEVQTLGGLLGQWFESEDKATFREDFPLWAVKTAKQAGQFMTYKFAIMAGAAASGLQDVYNNINNLPTVPGELQDIESRLVLTGLDAVGAAESLKRLGTATSMGSIYALSQEQIRQQDLQKMRSYSQGNEVFSPAISNAASFFYHLNRISARTGVSTAELLDMLPKWVELSELNPDMYSIEDLASDYINMQWKSGFQLAAEGAPDAEIETPVGTLVSSPEGSLEGAVSFARNVFNSFNRDVGFTEEERQLRAQMGASGELPQEVFGVGVGRAPWSPDAPGMDPVALDGKGVRFSERKNAQHQATEYWKNSTPDDAAKMDRYIRAELARRDTNAVYKAAENGLFGEAGRRNPDFFESMYTAQMINGQPIKRGMLSLYGLQMLYYFGRQMPYDMAASVLSTPLLLSTMSKEEVDRYADNLSSSPIMPMDMTKDEMVEMLEYGHAYHIREPLNAALDMMSAGTVGNYGLKSIVAGTQAGKYLRDPLPGLESSVQAAISGPLHEPKPDMPPQSADPIERGAQTVREAIAERKNTELDIAELEALRGEPLTKREMAAIKYGATSGQAIAGLSALFTNAGYALGRARNRSEAFNRYVSGEKRDPDKPLDVYEERNQTPGDATTFDDPFGVGANRLPARIRADMAKAAAAQEPQRAPLAIEVGPWEEARRKAKRPTEKGREDLERAQADGRKLINPDTGREFMPPPSSRAGEGPAPLRPEVVVEGPSISRDKAREAAAEGDPAALAVVEAAREVVREDAVATVPITDRASRAKEFLEKTEGMGPEKSANAARRFVSRFYPSAPESWLARFNQAVRERADHGAAEASGKFSLASTSPDKPPVMLRIRVAGESYKKTGEPVWRDVVVVNHPDGTSKAYYRSSGESGGGYAGKWIPFEGWVTSDRVPVGEHIGHGVGGNTLRRTGSLDAATIQGGYGENPLMAKTYWNKGSAEAPPGTIHAKASEWLDKNLDSMNIKPIEIDAGRGIQAINARLSNLNKSLNKMGAIDRSADALSLKRNRMDDGRWVKTRRLLYGLDEVSSIEPKPLSTRVGGGREAAESTLKGLLDEAVMAPRGDIAPPPSLGVPEVTRGVPGAKPPKPDKMTRDMLGTEVKTDAEGMARVDVVEGGPGGIVQELGMFNKDGSTDLTTYISTTPMLQRVLAMAARGQGGRHLYEWMNNKHKEDPKGPGKALTSAELTMAAGLSMQRRAELRKSSTAASSKSIPTSRSASDRSVRHARHLYDEAVAAAAMREGVTPSEWLLINKVQEIAHSFVEMGVSDPSVYQQISKGGYTVSAKQASSLAQAGARRVGRPSVIPKDKFNAADAMRLPGNKVSGMEPWVLPREGESPYRALDTEATMTPESRFADMARRGDRIGRDTKLPVMQRYQFGTSDNPSWYKIASTFLDPRALDILTGREDVKVLGHSLNVGQRSLYAISEFMERPFAFANSLWHLTDLVGDTLRGRARGDTDVRARKLGRLPSLDDIYWAITGPNRKFGEPLAHELLRATRTADSYADLVKGVVQAFDSKNVVLRRKEMTRLLRDLDMADAATSIHGDFSTRGKKILKGVDAQRWLDIVKRFEDTAITDPNGTTYRVSEFMEPYAKYNGEWVSLAELEQRILFNEISPQQYRTGTTDFSYRSKGDVAWGDLTDQQRSIMLIANQYSRPLDRIFFDMSTQLIMSEHAMRMTLGKNDAFVLGEQLLKADKGSLVSKTTNWMADFYDSRANLAFVMDVYKSMTSAGASPEEIDGQFGALKLVDKQLGMIAPGGGRNSRETIADPKLKGTFTNEFLRERLTKEGIRYRKNASRKDLIEMQPELGLSEIYGLLWNSPSQGEYFSKYYANGKDPSGFIERYYNSRIWDTEFNYQQKVEHGLWDIRESSVKAASDIGTALAKQRLTLWMRQNGLILTHSEHARMVDDAVLDAHLSGGDAGKARQRAERLKENMFVSQKSGYWELPSGKEGKFFVHKYADDYMRRNQEIMEAGSNVMTKVHQAIKLGYIARTGTVIRNALSNYWIFGKMAEIPWVASGPWHQKAKDDLKASITGGKVSQEYLELMREGGAQGGGYQRSEMTKSESLARVHLELLEDFERAERHTGAEDIVGAIFGVLQEPAAGRKATAGSKTNEIFERMRLNDMRAPSAEWVDSASKKRRPPMDYIASGYGRAKDWVAQKYGLVDEGAKLSYAYQLMMDHGYTAKQAHKTVNDTFMAWDNVAPLIDTIRNRAWGIALAGPFISFAIMATEKAHRMIAKDPKKAMIWANLLKSTLSATAAITEFDRDELLREMLDTGDIALPMLSSQEGKPYGWFSTEGVAGTRTTAESIARAEGGVVSLSGGLVNPISSYDANQRDVRPRSTLGKMFAMISFLGTSPLTKAVQSYLDDTEEPIPSGGTPAHNGVMRDHWDRLGSAITEISPGAVKDILGVVSAARGGEKVSALGVSVSRSMLEGISGPLGWSMKITSPTKKALYVEKRLKAVRSDVYRRIADLIKEQRMVGETADITKEIERLNVIADELPGLMQQVTKSRDKVMLDSYHLWYPRLVAMYSDDPFSPVMVEIEESIGASEPGSKHYNDVMDMLDVRTKHYWDRYVTMRDAPRLHLKAIGREGTDYPAPAPMD